MHVHAREVSAIWLNDAAELERDLKRHKMLLELARHNGFEIELVEREDLKGVWWMVPAELHGVTGFMMGRVE